MAAVESKHVVVEIIGDDDEKKHPLMEIAESAGHLLLLKLWQREEEVSGRRVAIKERRLDSIRSDIFHSCCFFYAFYSFFITLVYASSTSYSSSSSSSSRINYYSKWWWIPSVICVVTCVAITFLVQMKVCRYWKVGRQLQREKGEARAVNRRIQELRMKGASFDLSKLLQDPAAARMSTMTKKKSSSVEVKWFRQPLAWCSHYLITVFFLSLTGVAVPATKFILCSS